MSKQCSVFVSSTSEDLNDFRAAARDAVLAAGLKPVMMEYFAASGGPVLRECLDLVSPCEVVVVLVAQRYGWVPREPSNSDAKSITWLECEYAAARGKELLVFMLDDPKWPVERTEAYRASAAIEAGVDTQELLAEVKRNHARLKDFRQWLESQRTRVSFTSPDDLRAKVIQALHDWLEEHPEFRPRVPRRLDPQPYLRWLRDQSATIDIRGLGVGTGKAHSFPIQELYIPLTTRSESTHHASRSDKPEQEQMELQDVLNDRRNIMIIGDPGSGKTTFLRRVSFELTNTILAQQSGILIPSNPHEQTNALTKLRSFFRQSSSTGVTSRSILPLFTRVAELTAHINQCIGECTDLERRAKEWIQAKWLSHFLATRSAAHGWGLSEDFFAERLKSGEAIALLDGLDEATDQTERNLTARLFEEMTHVYDKCQFVATTRPQSYRGPNIVAGFHAIHIEPLTRGAVETFLGRWCQGLYPESAHMAEEHRKELSRAVQARSEISSMASNPVMLTALAVVHWNERRLPEQRADLYDSILTWLSRARERRPGREKADRCLTLLGQLAFVMQAHPAGRQVNIDINRAAAALGAC